MKATKLVNLTPHEIKIVVGDATVVLPPSGCIARVDTETVPVGTVEVDGVTVELHASRYVGLRDLPAPKPGVVYVVSAVVQQACSNRTDLYTPGNLIRNGQGQVIGCSRLERFVHWPLPNLAGSSSDDK